MKTPYRGFEFEIKKENGNLSPVCEIYKEGVIYAYIDPNTKSAKDWIDAEIGNSDSVNHPPSGIECITITEHMNFCLGNAIKYIWRAGLKKDNLEDLRKAAWYLNREIARLPEDA